MLWCATGLAGTLQLPESSENSVSAFAGRSSPVRILASRNQPSDVSGWITARQIGTDVPIAVTGLLGQSSLAVIGEQNLNRSGTVVEGWLDFEIAANLVA